MQPNRRRALGILLVIGLAAACADRSGPVSDPEPILPTLAEVSPHPDRPGRGRFRPTGPNADEIRQKLREIVEGPGGVEWAVDNGMRPDRVADYRRYLADPESECWTMQLNRDRTFQIVSCVPKHRR